VALVSSIPAAVTMRGRPGKRRPGRSPPRVRDGSSLAGEAEKAEGHVAAEVRSGTGDLGFVHRGSVRPELEQEIFEAEIPSLKGPARTMYGYQIVAGPGGEARRTARLCPMSARPWRRGSARARKGGSGIVRGRPHPGCPSGAVRVGARALGSGLLLIVAAPALAGHGAHFTLGIGAEYLLDVPDGRGAIGRARARCSRSSPSTSTETSSTRGFSSSTAGSSRRAFRLEQTGVESTTKREFDYGLGLRPSAIAPSPSRSPRCGRFVRHRSGGRRACARGGRELPRHRRRPSERDGRSSGFPKRCSASRPTIRRPFATRGATCRS